MIIIRPSNTHSAKCHCCGRACDEASAQKRIYYFPTNNPYKHIRAQVEYPTCVQCQDRYYNHKSLRRVLAGVTALIVLATCAYIYTHSSQQGVWALAVFLGILFSCLTYVGIYESVKTKKDLVLNTDLHISLVIYPNQWYVREIAEGDRVEAYSEEAVRAYLDEMAKLYDLTIVYPPNAFQLYDNVDYSSD